MIEKSASRGGRSEKLTQLNECSPHTEIFSKRRKIYAICVKGLRLSYRPTMEEVCLEENAQLFAMADGVQNQACQSATLPDGTDRQYQLRSGFGCMYRLIGSFKDSRGKIMPRGMEATWDINLELKRGLDVLKVT